MVVDEELKMMCDICNEGGQVLGPFLKPMTHLVHTEYLLAGRTTRDVREVLRDTMFAATVTGAPVENACRLIKKYETEGRGYYGAALALLGRDADGAPTADSPIVIRTADVVARTGALKVTAGATLVRDSDPAYEVAETLRQGRRHPHRLRARRRLRRRPPTGVEELTRDEDVLIALASRNQRLSKFWLTDQGGAPPAPELKGRTAAILEGEDDFVNMLRHVLTVLGHDRDRGAARRLRRPGALDGYDLVIVGPGPGRPPGRVAPEDRGLPRRDRRAAVVRAAVPAASASATRCSATGSGFPLPTRTSSSRARSRGSRSAPGARRRSSASTTPSSAGPTAPLPDGRDASATDPATGDVHVVAGPHFRGVQFHAESILTENGFALLRDLVLELLLGLTRG